MSDIISFKERVRQVAINEARHYKRMFVDYDYLICCNTFTNKKYYVISGEKNNYAHLLGINILCSPNEFFAKCISNSLTENDFDFFKSGQRETDVKGTVRRKITSLEKMKYRSEYVTNWKLCGRKLVPKRSMTLLLLGC